MPSSFSRRTLAIQSDSGADSVVGPLALRSLDSSVMDPVIRMALREDEGAGDVTSSTSVPEKALARASLIAKADGVLSGIEVFLRVFQICDPEARLQAFAEDGDKIQVGHKLAEVVGNARALLLAERSALNLLQRMSGIATRTRRFVDCVQATGSEMAVLDTRKTTPGLRALEKYAVLCGGGQNHRFGLEDQVLLKENHIDLAGKPIEEILKGQRAALGEEMILTAEARNAEEARAALRGGADVVLLDNMAPEAMAQLGPELRALAKERGRPIQLEASGGIDERTLEAVARTGVDRVSVGALTHSVEALDLSLYLEPFEEGTAEAEGKQA